MMAAWLEETERIHAKTEPLTVLEEFFVNLTLEFDWAREHQPHDRRYLGFLLPNGSHVPQRQKRRGDGEIPFVSGDRSAGMSGALGVMCRHGCRGEDSE